MALIGEETGAIRLAGFPSVFATVLPPLLRRFRTLHPGIDLVPLETDDLEVEAWLAAGSIDLGVVLNPSPARNAVPLGRDAWVPILPAAHSLSRRPSVSLAELAAAPFVLATGGCHTNARSLAEAEGLTLQNVQIEVRDWSSAIALVREGAGVSLVPESTLPEQHRGFRFRNSLRRCIASSDSSLRKCDRSPGPETCSSSWRVARPRQPLHRARPEGGTAYGLEPHDAPSTSFLLPKVKKLSADSTQTPMAP